MYWSDTFSFEGILYKESSIYRVRKMPCPTECVQGLERSIDFMCCTCLQRSHSGATFTAQLVLTGDDGISEPVAASLSPTLRTFSSHFSSFSDVVTIDSWLPLQCSCAEAPTPQNDLEVSDLTKFAINEHNSRQNSDLEYASIVSAHKKVVAVLMYHLKLRASSGGNVNVYEAKLWIKPWENFKLLENFERVESLFSLADLGKHLNDFEALGLRPISSDDPTMKEVAKEALKSVQARSNSLVPYELKEVVSTHAEVSDEHTKSNVLFKVHQGTKEEQFKAEVLRTVVGDWTLKYLLQHN
ncbi:hypothetical protein L7F22_040595 [Adiantum nelumboides]|nr:hypothetical protein [Adiantum nelumboides]